MIPQEYFNKVKSYFRGDEQKTWDWFRARNPAFGMFSPLTMIKLGRGNKVIKFIDNALINGFYP